MELIIFFVIFIFYLINRYTDSRNRRQDNPDFFTSLFNLQETDRYGSEDFDSYRIPSKPFIYIHPTDKQAYLKSAKWQTLRKAVLKRDQYTCQSCKTNGESLEVHHLHYQTFGNESTADLISLCRDCHQAIHDKHGYDYNDTFPI